MSGNDRQLRLGLEQVIQMMKAQAPQEVVVAPKESWPPIAWVLIQAEAEGNSRGKLAEQLGVSVPMLDDMIEELIQTSSQEVRDEVWQIGVISLKSASMLTSHVIATTWDQVEAMAIDKLATAIQNVDGKNVDPMKLAAIASQANKAIRRGKGEGSGHGGGMGLGGIELEMQSGDLGSIRLRLSPRVIAQMSNSEKVIDSVARDVTKVHNMEMLRLKEIRPIAEALESEVDTKAQADAAESLRQSKVAERDRRGAELFGDMELLKGIHGIKVL